MKIITQNILLALTLITALLPLSPAPAQVPSWWPARGVLDPNQPPNDFARINQGQLKRLAQNTFLELDDLGAAGPELTALIAGFSNTNNFAPVNIGQLKNLAQPFYDRLYDLDLTNVMPVGMTNHYPWDNLPGTNDYALANNGQAKYLFSFNLWLDSDNDGLPDAWEVSHGTDRYNPDTDGDGLPDGWEVDHGFDPLNDEDADEGEAALIKDARQRIVSNSRIVLGTTPVFTNQPGSAADLIDLKNALNALSGKNYQEQ